MQVVQGPAKINVGYAPQVFLHGVKKDEFVVVEGKGAGDWYEIPFYLFFKTREEAERAMQNEEEHQQRKAQKEAREKIRKELRQVVRLLINKMGFKLCFADEIIRAAGISNAVAAAAWAREIKTVRAEYKNLIITVLRGLLAMPWRNNNNYASYCCQIMNAIGLASLPTSDDAADAKRLRRLFRGALVALGEKL